MKQRLIVIIIVLAVICLLAASIVSISRAKYLPSTPEKESQSGIETEEPSEQESQSGIETEEPSEQESEMLGSLAYTEYTKEAHPGTGIAYRGSGTLADKIIVIDAGHQLHAMSDTEPNGPGSTEMKAKVTGGTQGATTGLAEYELNLRVSLALRDVLVEQGYCVVMVRETNEVEISNAERAQLANEVGADVLIRIHANGDENASVKGAMTVCQTPVNPYNANIYQECRLLSDTVLQAFCAGTGIEQRNVWETDTMTGTNWASVPTTIVEMGFMTNAEDEAAMAAEGFAEKAAKAIASGIADYFAQKETLTETAEPGTTPPSSQYDIDYEREAELGESFVEVYMIMEATGTVWVRTEPSTEGGESTQMQGIVMTKDTQVVCIGLGKKWNRVLIDGNVYYISAAYLKEVEQ